MKKINMFITTIALTLILGAITTSAATLMSYNGTSIWSKLSVGTFSLNNKSNNITIYHTTSYHSGGNELQITVCRQNFLGMYSDKKDYHIVRGNGDWNLDSYGLPRGVYKLLFERTADSGCFNIHGRVSQ